MHSGLGEVEASLAKNARFVGSAVEGKRLTYSCCLYWCSPPLQRLIANKGIQQTKFGEWSHVAAEKAAARRRKKELLLGFNAVAAAEAGAEAAAAAAAAVAASQAAQGGGSTNKKDRKKKVRGWGHCRKR